jgi:PAS domain S-box-containing protein
MTAAGDPWFFDSAGVGLVLIGEDGRPLRANRACGRLLGHEPEKIAGTDLLQLVHPDDHRHLADMREELRSGRADRSERELRFRRSDGSAFWGLATLTRLGDSGELLAVVQDIDARKAAEDEVRRLSGRLLLLQDEERRRVSRALHESAAQSIAALSLTLQRMERMQLPPQAAEPLADSLALVSQATREIRTLSHLLHPPLLEEAGLASALRWYLEGFGARSDVKVALEVAPDLGRLSGELEITLFRIVQEGLTNVHRHSGSRTAAVRLRRSGHDVALEVEDRGVGVPADALQGVREGKGGVGIAGMRERVAQLGGTLEIDSGPQGTVVRALLRSDA